MIVDVVRCKECKHRGTEECPMYHIELVEYDDYGYLDLQDVIYDYTEDNGYCDRGEKNKWLYQKKKSKGRIKSRGIKTSVFI